MGQINSVVAVFADHSAADAAVRKLGVEGFPIHNLSVIGKGYHSEEKVVGFYSTAKRAAFWGSRGAFWGGLWGLFFGGLLLPIPVLGHVVVLGYLAATLISGVESAALVGGASAIGAALYGLGLPKNSVLEYETAIKADRFLVMAHGTAKEVAEAQGILASFTPSSIESYAPDTKPEPTDPVLTVGSADGLAEAGIPFVHS